MAVPDAYTIEHWGLSMLLKEKMQIIASFLDAHAEGYLDKILGSKSLKEKNTFIKTILDVCLTDKNSSLFRETYSLTKAGYVPWLEKLGYDGVTPDGIPVEVKPLTYAYTTKNGIKKKKLNGRGSFSDLTWARYAKFKKDKPILLISGFIEGKIQYLFEAPMICPGMQKILCKRLSVRLPNKKDVTNVYARGVKFDWQHYHMHVTKFHYLNPDIESYSDCFTKDFYSWLVKNDPCEEN